MIHRLVPILSTALCGLVPGQDEASTLARLAARADLVVQARAVIATDPDPTQHRFEFALQAALRGRAPARFSLQEPAGPCCGRALHAVTVGRSYLMFLGSGSGPLHLLGGERGMEPADPALLAHVRELLAAAPAARADVLARALENPHARARRDAALALPWEPMLESAGREARRRIAEAAPRLLAAGDTALSGVLTAAVRLRLAEVATDLLPAYLDGRAGDLEGLLVANLPRLDAAGLCRAIAVRLPADGASGLRAVRLLDRIGDREARPPLLRLLREGEAGCRTEAAAALLRAGLQRQDLQPWAPPALLDDAERRLARPRFRAVRPGGGP